jgi:heme-degrading monooxygenase HmoA
MHAQIVTFGLRGITEDEYHDGCEEETGFFAELPGLIAKIWLRNSTANEYGAVYLWADREAYETYVSGEVFRSIKEDPTLADVSSRDFEVFEDLTALTQPGMTLP